MAHASLARLVIILETADVRAVTQALTVIEEGRWIELKKGWRARVDRTHHDPSSTHVHVQFRGNQIAVINRNRTSSHGSDLDQVPGWVWTKLANKRIIESASVYAELQTDSSVPRDVLQKLDEVLAYGSRAARLLRDIGNLR